MLNVLGLNERAVRHFMGMLYKALILGTLSAMFVFAPLKQSFESTAQSRTAVIEVPESDGRKVLWLNPSRVAMGQGDSFTSALEE